MPNWLIAADDRTGALEVAGALVGSQGPAIVVSGPRSVHSLQATTVVVDIATRHSTAAVAAARSVIVEALPSERTAHKIDSTLRGNWAYELVARHRVAGRRVLVIPALPHLGRTCL
ncbi:MAG: four-carbon acid sugar kinase family protein, partial [Ilumatobacteraceae bacterium]